MTRECRTLGSLRTVPAEDWNRLGGGCAFHLSHEWLSAIELLAGGRYEPRYFVVHDSSGTLVAAAPAYTVENPSHYALYNPYDLLDPSGSALRRESLFPALLCGSASGYEGGVLVDPGLAERDRDRALSVLVAAIEDHAERQGIRTVAFAYLPAAAVGRLARVLEGGYVRLLAGADCRLAVAGATFDDYVAGLGRSRRSSVRREVARFERSGLRVRVGRLSECPADLPAMIANVQRRYGHRADAGRFSANIDAYTRCLDRHSRVFLAERGDVPVGFTLYFEWHGTYHGRLAGFAYEHLDREGCYFNLAYYYPLRAAMDEGVSEIDLGVESYEAKLSRGCDAYPLRWFVKVAGVDRADVHQLAQARSAETDRHLRELAARFGRRWP
jgi:uncharacterized protein